MDKQKSSQGVSYTGLGAALGLVLGGLVGVLIGNPIIFAGGGMVLGVAVGSALARRG
jgi:uncharacterized membrane protein